METDMDNQSIEWLMGLPGGHEVPSRVPLVVSQTPKRIQQLDPVEPYGKFYWDYIGVVLGLFRGSNF